MTQLTEHFTLAELSVTSHRDIDNTPPDEIIPKLKVVAQGLERMRLVLGKPVLSLSGYRCPALNCMVGGAMTSVSLTKLLNTTPYDFVRAFARARLMQHKVQQSDSQHMDGEADDCIAPAFGTPYEVARAIEANRSEVQFDQLIFEGTWVHASFIVGLARMQVLTLVKGRGYVDGLVQ